MRRLGTLGSELVGVRVPAERPSSLAGERKWLRVEEGNSEPLPCVRLEASESLALLRRLREESLTIAALRTRVKTQVEPQVSPERQVFPTVHTPGDDEGPGRWTRLRVTPGSPPPMQLEPQGPSVGLPAPPRLPLADTSNTLGQWGGGSWNLQGLSSWPGSWCRVCTTDVAIPARTPCQLSPREVGSCAKPGWTQSEARAAQRPHRLPPVSRGPVHPSPTPKQGPILCPAMVGCHVFCRWLSAPGAPAALT